MTYAKAGGKNQYSKPIEEDTNTRQRRILLEIVMEWREEARSEEARSKELAAKLGAGKKRRL